MSHISHQAVDEDVLVTDSASSHASALWLLEGVKSIASKPVRYLVDTHLHIDHASGIRRGRRNGRSEAGGLEQQLAAQQATLAVQ